MRNILLLVLLIFGAGFHFAVWAQETKATVKDKTAKVRLLGKHPFSLQWISWNHFGIANVIEHKGVLRITGKQKSRENADFVTIDGFIVQIEKDQFTFDGKIITKVSYINNGKECVRQGEVVFKITGKRKYWRLQQMLNPCSNVETDYIDIYLR